MIPVCLPLLLLLSLLPLLLLLLLRISLISLTLRLGLDLRPRFLHTSTRNLLNPCAGCRLRLRRRLSPLAFLLILRCSRCLLLLLLLLLHLLLCRHSLRSNCDGLLRRRRRILHLRRLERKPRCLISLRRRHQRALRQGIRRKPRCIPRRRKAGAEAPRVSRRIWWIWRAV